MVASFVIDASAALTTVLPDEDSSLGEVLLEKLSEGAVLLVPTLWHLETSNVLLVKEFR